MHSALFPRCFANICTCETTFECSQVSSNKVLFMIRNQLKFNYRTISRANFYWIPRASLYWKCNAIDLTLLQIRKEWKEKISIKFFFSSLNLAASSSRAMMKSSMSACFSLCRIHFQIIIITILLSHGTFQSFLSAHPFARNAWPNARRRRFRARERLRCLI